VKIIREIKKLIFVIFCLILLFPSCDKSEELVSDDDKEETIPGEQYYKESKVAVGYSASSVNAVVFRRNSLVTFNGS